MVAIGLDRLVMVLTDTDWAELDAAFAQNRDPLAGAVGEDEYAELFSRIVRIVPAPIGLGPQAQG